MLLAGDGRVPAHHAAAGAADLDRHAQPIRRQPGGADRRVFAGVRAVGLHFRNQQHAAADSPDDLFLPARYYVTCLQTLFLAGDVMPVLLPATWPCWPIAVVLLAAVRLLDPDAFGVTAMWQRIRTLIVKELLAVCARSEEPRHPDRAAAGRDVRLRLRGHAGGEGRARGGAEPRPGDRRARSDRPVRGLAEFFRVSLRRAARPTSRRQSTRGSVLAGPALSARTFPAVAGGRAGRGANHARRPALQRGPDRRRLRHRIVARYNQELAARTSRTDAGQRGRAAHLVQSESADDLEFGALRWSAF